MLRHALLSGTGTLFGIHQEEKLAYLMCKTLNPQLTISYSIPIDTLGFKVKKNSNLSDTERSHAGSKGQSSASYTTTTTRLRSRSLEHGILLLKSKLFPSTLIKGA
jgi:hypothetical protein